MGGDQPAHRYPHGHRSVYFHTIVEQRDGCTISVVFQPKKEMSAKWIN
jgi:hypothetical protein